MIFTHSIFKKLTIARLRNEDITYQNIHVKSHRILFDLRKCYEDICTGGRTKDVKNKSSVSIAKDM